MVTFGLVQVGFRWQRNYGELFRKQKCLGFLDSGCFFFEGNQKKLLTYIYIFIHIYIYLLKYF